MSTRSMKSNKCPRWSMSPELFKRPWKFDHDTMCSPRALFIQGVRHGPFYPKGQRDSAKGFKHCSISSSKLFSRPTKSPSGHKVQRLNWATYKGDDHIKARHKAKSPKKGPCSSTMEPNYPISLHGQWRSAKAPNCPASLKDATRTPPMMYLRSTMAWKRQCHLRFDQAHYKYTKVQLIYIKAT